jgi:hypothetical protein
MVIITVCITAEYILLHYPRMFIFDIQLFSHFMVSVCLNGLNLELYGKFSLNLCFIDNGRV